MFDMGMILRGGTADPDPGASVRRGRRSRSDGEGLCRVPGAPFGGAKRGDSVASGSITAASSGGESRVREDAQRVSAQRHIRQHMPARPGIIIPAVPFASRADRSVA
ncbi:hypothetical protein GCM10010921_28300 [Microbacterium album]|uniref:Uncharacterized protein n=1 Tax=Microbacterium album TaxID=2053191 RepID=A0A917IIU9_9MICO|nr:hypothetical protein GCM10010921_28300 [Microbacterium album]